MSEAFADRWSRKWAACGFGGVYPDDDEDESIGTEFASCGGAVLPTEAAPYLRFDRAARPAPIGEAFGIPSQWPPADRARLAPFRVIGSDGAGNPICVEQPGGAVVLLDHEDQFRARQFVNTSVGHLAECLLAYLGERDAGRFRAAVQAIDPAAMAERSFWWHAAAGLT